MLNEYFIRNLLHLPDNFQLSFQQSDSQELNLVITQERQPHPCPSCGHITDRIHDYRLQSVSDIPLQKEAFHLVFRKRRYVLQTASGCKYFLPFPRCAPSLILQMNSSVPMPRSAEFCWISIIQSQQSSLLCWQLMNFAEIWEKNFNVF